MKHFFFFNIFIPADFRTYIYLMQSFKGYAIHAQGCNFLKCCKAEPQKTMSKKISEHPTGQYKSTNTWGSYIALEWVDRC